MTRLTNKGTTTLIIFLVFFIALIYNIGTSPTIFKTVSDKIRYLPEDTRENYVEIRTPLLIVGEKRINIEMADTPSARIRGLSGRMFLEDGSGMLFVFGLPDKYGFWMKDMHFSIDIAWLDKDFRIVHIEHGASPDSFPKIFEPRTPATYVLEISSGFFENNELKVGDILTFEDVI